jgi:peptidoglycan LD-endopeptidase LytH
MWSKVQIRRAGGQTVAALIVVALSSVMVPGAAGADHGGQAAAQAAREIQDARDRANAAAQAMFDAESRLDQLAIEITGAEQQLATVEAEASEMRASLQQGALRSFANAGSSNPLLVDLDDANDGITASRQASVARGSAAVELDDFAAVMVEVNAAREELDRQRRSTDQARQQYEDLQRSAEAEVVKLAEIEKERLQDEAVQHELERQRRIREEQEAAAAAAAAAAAESARRAAAAPSSNSSSRPSSGNGASGGAAAAPAPRPAPAPAPAPSGGSAPQAPRPAPVPPSPPPSNAGSGIVCPVRGPHAFADTWGAARSGGRSHEGVDMMASRGTPLVAVESGSVQFKTTRLGGNSVWLNGSSGTRYFYAHLSAWEGSSRSVSRGEVIGYVGATGNTTANHLHFEVHPGGGRAVNPYPYVRAVC